jgi:hypothetical protein
MRLRSSKTISTRSRGGKGLDAPDLLAVELEGAGELGDGPQAHAREGLLLELGEEALALLRTRALEALPQ